MARGITQKQLAELREYARQVGFREGRWIYFKGYGLGNSRQALEDSGVIERMGTVNQLREMGVKAPKQRYGFGFSPGPTVFYRTRTWHA